MNSDTPVVLCAADNRYSMPLAVMLRSLADNLAEGGSVAVWVLHGGMSLRNRWRITRFLPSNTISVHWVRVNKALLSTMPVFGHVSLATYFRLLMPYVLPREIHKAIYLDVDLVVKGDINEFWQEKSITRYSLMAIEEPKWSSHESRDHRVELGMNPDNMYFNAGVLLVNLDEWRRLDIPNLVMKFLNDKKAIIKWHDQDGLNAVLEGQWGRIGVEWNTRVDPHSPVSDPLGLLTKAKIIHYASAVKPWSYFARNPDVQLFYQYLDRTAWKGWRPRRPWRMTIGNRYWYGGMVRRLPVVGAFWEGFRRKDTSTRERGT